MDKKQVIDDLRKRVNDKIEENKNVCDKLLLLPDNLYLDSINSLTYENSVKILKGEKAPEIDGFLQEFPIATTLEKEYQNKFKQKYESIKETDKMNIKFWAKLRLYKNTDGSILFINLENSDISDLRIAEVYEVSDRFTLYPGDKIYLYNTPYTIEYVGMTNNSILFKYDWIRTDGYATIPFGVNDVRICVSVDDDTTWCPILTEEEYGTDLDYSLEMFKIFLSEKTLPKIVEPSSEPKYLYLDAKYTMFLNEDAEREHIEGNFYKITNLKYGVFVRVCGEPYIDSVITEIYCEKGQEKSLAERLIKMIKGEYDEKIEIASM